MKIPKLTDTSTELRTLLERDAELASREANLKTDAQRLRTLISDGGDPGREDRVALMIAGQAVPASSHFNLQLEDVTRARRDIEIAREILARQISKAKFEAGGMICKNLTPKHDAILKRLCASLLEAHAAHLEYWILRRELIQNEIGLHGIFNLTPDTILGAAINKRSDLADFFREALKAGHIRSLPDSLR